MTNDNHQTGSTTVDRIHWFCEHFKLEVPPLEYETEEPHIGALLLSDDLLKWCVAEGVNLDWLFCGDTRGLLADYRDRELEKQGARQFVKLTDKLEPEVKEGLFTAIRAVVQFGVPMPEAIAELDKVVTEHRKNRAA